MNARCDMELFVLREFCCPGCGTAVAQDVQPRDEPMREESRFAVHLRASRPETTPAAKGRRR